MAIRADDVDLQRDRALVERYQAGDDAAFDELYRRYYGRLARFCQKRVLDHSEAEDVAQEAFVRALSAMPRFDGEKRFYPWVSVIAARLCVDSYRRQSRTEPVAEPDAGTVDPDLDGLDRAADRALLALALERVDPRHREVLRLREEEGWPYQRIADHFGVSLGTVEALLFRARRSLRREYLAAADGAPSPRKRLAGRLTGLAAFAPLRAAGRRLAAIRDRVAALGGQLAPVAGTVSFAVATTAAGLAGSAAAGSGAPVVAFPVAAWSAPVAAPASAAVPGALAATPASPATPAFGTAVTTSALRAPAPSTHQARGPLLQLRGASVTGDGSAASQAGAMPIHASTGPVAVGTDPGALVSSNVQALQAWLHTLARLP